MIRELFRRASQALGIVGRTQASNGAATCGRRAKVADIQATATGRVFYEVDDTLAAIICEAFPSEIRRARKKSATQPVDVLTPQWCVAKNEGGEGFHLQCKIGSRVECCDAPPKKAVEAFASIGLQVPPSVLVEYAALLERSSPEWRSPGFVLSLA